MEQIRKRLASGVLCIAMAFCLLAANANAADIGFTDVPANHWAKPYIQIASDNGFVTGVGGNQFAPDKSVSPVEFTTMVMRAFYPNDVTSSTDPWYKPYMMAGMRTNILAGTQMWDMGLWSTIGTQPMNRYEMAMVAYNAMREAGALKGVSIDGIESSISDWSSVPTNYQWAVRYCYATGVLTGTDSTGKFSGSTTMTRAQACTVLVRMDETINDKSYDIDNPSDNTDSGNQNTGNNSGTIDESYILAKLEELKAKYPEGSVYDIYNSTNGDIYDAKTQTYHPNVNHVLSCYRPNVKPGNYGRFYDCAAWAWYVSDYVFGNAPIKSTKVYYEIDNWDAIKIGDVIEEGNSAHWGFVIEKGIGWDGDLYIRYTDSGSTHVVYWDDGSVRWATNVGTAISKITVYSRY